MRPHSNSRPYNPNNQRPNINNPNNQRPNINNPNNQRPNINNPNNQPPNINGANASAPQQGFGSQGNFGPNQMQIRPQFPVGLLNNPQLVMPPFNNPNAYFAATQFLPFVQGPMQTINTNNSPQFFPQNAVNQPNFFPNGQLNMPNLVQNVAQLLQMQMANCGPQNLGPFANAQMGLTNGSGVNCGPQNMGPFANAQMGSASGNGVNRGPQNMGPLVNAQMGLANGNGVNCGPQNLGPFSNAQSGLANGNAAVPQSVDGDGLKNLKQNAAVTQDFGSPKMKQNQNVFSPGAVNSQSNPRVFNGDNDRKNSWRNSHNKNFNGNFKQDASERGNFRNNQFHHRQNTQGNFQFNNENGGRGNTNNGLKNFSLPSPGEQIQVGKKRSFVLNYTEQEIQQWRESRRKNHPSNSNTEKKSKENPTQPEVIDEVAKMRRQQLKEILAKQAELGCEVAEVPSHYLSDSEQQNSKEFGKRENFRNKFDKRNKFNKFDRFSKNQRWENRNSANTQNQSDRFTKKPRCEPSLLKKLLSSDIKRDKRHLVHVFRFMSMNSFFENFPEQPLKFPVVHVKESGDGSEILEELREAAEE